MSCQKSVTTSIAIRRTYHFQTHTNCRESFSRRLYARCAEFRGAQYLNGSPACAFSGNSSPSRRGWLAAGGGAEPAKTSMERVDQVEILGHRLFRPLPKASC